MYSKIVVCMSESEDEILAKQLGMLSERHHADVERVDAGKAVSIIDGCDPDILFISDDEALLSEARSKGIAINDPASMKKSYNKAMEMLKSLGKGHI